jgi:hypothetical protein
MPCQTRIRQNFGAAPAAAAASDGYGLGSWETRSINWKNRMPRTPAKVTQTDISRALRAARQAGAAEVAVLPDGKIVIRLESSTEPRPEALEVQGGIVL